jgi:hypothetical protein
MRLGSGLAVAMMRTARIKINMAYLICLRSPPVDVGSALNSRRNAWTTPSPSGGRTNSQGIHASAALLTGFRG